MATDNKKPDKSDTDNFIAETRRKHQEIEKTYRQRALKLYPWICGRCGREFGGKNLKELTVHHKDHNHDNNPMDGSNWELLCLYCHDNEHARNAVANAYSHEGSETPAKPTLSHQPFAALEALLKSKK